MLWQTWLITTIPCPFNKCVEDSIKMLENIHEKMPKNVIKSKNYGANDQIHAQPTISSPNNLVPSSPPGHFPGACSSNTDLCGFLKHCKLFSHPIIYPRAWPHSFLNTECSLIPIHWNPVTYTLNSGQPPLRLEVYHLDAFSWESFPWLFSWPSHPRPE